MNVEPDPTIGQVLELWRTVFGEPPAILIEPTQMMILIKAHVELTRIVVPQEASV